MGQREQILEMQDLPLTEVKIKEWGTTVYVRGMSAAERDKFESDMFDVTGKDVKVKRDNLRAKLVALCVCDLDGNRLFKDEDIPALGKKNARAVDKLFTIAQKLSGIGANDVEEMVKNSESVPQD
jgi:hypothetical protein